jgi:hypothetical protein
MSLKYTNKTSKVLLLAEANDLYQQRTVLFYLLVITFTIGVLF